MRRKVVIGVLKFQNPLVQQTGDVDLDLFGIGQIVPSLVRLGVIQCVLVGSLH
jgi:hypothetical protein